MEFRRITTPADRDFQALFALYESSFPIHEQRTREKEEALLGNPACHTLALREQGAFAGLMALWEGDGFTYVEHFAVAPQLRGRGVGSRALAELTGRGRPVVLEIDPPVDEGSLRRRRFYQRLGFVENGFPHVHPPYRRGFSGHPLVVMTCPAAWQPAQYRAFAALLSEQVMADCGINER